MGRLSPGELPVTPHDKVVAYLPVWREYRGRFQRTEGLDAHVKASWDTVSNHMDTLIEAFVADIIVVTPIETDYAEALTQENEVSHERGSN